MSWLLVRARARMGIGVAALLLALPACDRAGSPAGAHADADVPAATQPPPKGTPAPSSPRPEDAFDHEGLSAIAPLPVVGWPTESVHLTSFFGWRVDPVTGKGTRLHRGLDLRARPGDLLMSIAPGRVRFVGHDYLLGNLVVIDHGLGIESYYGHLTDPLVHTGLPVERGTAIGVAGNTGRSAAPHLHLAIRIGDVPVDPLHVLRQPLHPAPALARELEPDQGPLADDP